MLPSPRYLSRRASRYHPLEYKFALLSVSGMMSPKSICPGREHTLFSTKIEGIETCPQKGEKINPRAPHYIVDGGGGDTG